MTLATRLPLAGFAGELAAHQQAALDWLADRPKAVLADDVGLGKTAVALARIDQLNGSGRLANLRPDAQRGSCRVLWLTEPTLIEQTRSEVGRFLPGYTVATSDDYEWTSSARKAHRQWGELYGAGPDILIVSYDQAVAAGRRGWLQRIVEPSFLVMDEVSSLGQGKQYDQIHDNLTSCVPFILSMTATPLQNDPMELYAVLSVTGTPDLWSQADYESMVQFKLVNVDQWGREHYKPVGWANSGAASTVREYLHGSSHSPGVLLRRTAEDVGLQLPTIVREDREVDLTGAQLSAYEVGARRQGLQGHHQRLMAGRITETQSGGESVLVDELVHVLQACDRESAVVWCENINLLELAAEVLDRHGITHATIEGKVSADDRVTAIRHHGDGSVQVLLGTKVLEHGLNLQHSALLVSLDSSWNPARERQREGRIRRIGSPFATVKHVRILPKTGLATWRERALDSKLAVAEAVGL
jgi:SNF2 family DNA or RNA helicase